MMRRKTLLTNLILVFAVFAGIDVALGTDLAIGIARACDDTVCDDGSSSCGCNGGNNGGGDLGGGNNGGLGGGPGPGPIGTKNCWLCGQTPEYYGFCYTVSGGGFDDCFIGSDSGETYGYGCALSYHLCNQ
jgi:hypothetical protein